MLNKNPYVDLTKIDVNKKYIPPKRRKKFDITVINTGFNKYVK